MKILKTAHGT